MAEFKVTFRRTITIEMVIPADSKADLQRYIKAYGAPEIALSGGASTDNTTVVRIEEVSP